LANRKTPLRLDEGRIKKNEREEKKNAKLSLSKLITTSRQTFFFFFSLSLSLFLFRPRDVKSA
jgi:hypothetical protein